ncbi:uncharacterized protein BDZ99DRAFT_466402 [Mytilinidion resinicola]|uniref:Uncharacterized protein n=1 Tax=Mytilinidion resinicola TaxID=574789 RepID=A0A6A6YC21_9PEZI|nr:uncharacterized protein BDZ99DRAFT_466402 [Mytilinidion resinicola]KAF2806128.1 hypothetical protein BDZ99DRAFT_466402 [Mytilinidion resinicola]
MPQLEHSYLEAGRRRNLERFNLPCRIAAGVQAFVEDYDEGKYPQNAGGSISEPEESEAEESEAEESGAEESEADEAEYKEAEKAVLEILSRTA